MATAVSPSVQKITTGQIAKLCDLISAGLRKAGLPSKQSQQVIERQGESLVVDFVEDFRQRVGAIRDPITRRVKVDRTRTPQEALDATGRDQCTDNNVVETMPRGEGEEAEVVFFKIGRYINDDQIEKEYALRGLKAADPISLAAVNEADSAFADEHPNGTHWKDAEGEWCFAVFDRCIAERRLTVDCSDDDWNDVWWFAGFHNS